MGRKSKISSSHTSETNSTANSSNGPALVPPPMNDIELLQQFDACTSSSSPEEGIQAARELYIVVVTRREALRRGMTILQEEKESLEKKSSEVANKNETEAGEVRRLLAQKERLVVLANELTKQKEAAIASTPSTAPTPTSTIDDLSRRINEVSTALEEVGKQRVATATTNDQLRETLRSMLNKSQADEASISTTLATKATRLAEVSAALETAIANTATEKERTPMLQAQAAELSAKEETLRSSLQEYAERFEHFQSSLNKSNELFSSFKRRMDDMARTINTYNKENSELDSRGEEMTTTIASMKQEKSLLDEEVARLEKVNSRLAAIVEALSARLGISASASCSPYCTCRCGAPLSGKDARDPLDGDICVAASANNADGSPKGEEKEEQLMEEDEQDSVGVVY